MNDKSLKNVWLLRVVFLLIPTLFLGYFLFQRAVVYWDIDNYSFVITQYICWALGLISAFVLLSFRLRPIIAIVANILLIVLINKIVTQYSQTEFFDFYLTYRLIFYAIGLIIGWFIVGKSIWQYVLGSILFLTSLLLFTRIFHDDYLKLTLSLGLVVISIGYLLFVSAQLRNIAANGNSSVRKLVFSILAFTLIFAGITFGLLQLFKSEIKNAINMVSEVDSFRSDAMTHTNADGSLSVNKSTSLTGNQKRGKALVFVAYIDNFFPSDSFPNPLYLTEYYYTKYDVKSQTFEIDSSRNLKDWFHPNPSSFPLYKPVIDSPVLSLSKDIAYKKVVDVKIYKVNMAPDEYVAPSTSFYLENMSVAGDNLKQFRSGYMAKSMVSDLNSAYLIYNTDRTDIKTLQSQRYDILKLKNEKSTLPIDDYQYYTQVPRGPDFEKIKNLALQITQGKHTDLEKMLAIRDYFNSKDPQGRPLFTYSDNPGEPDIPSANKLSYFLFENRKGYCAYYAGATLFMLRALGIPSRIAAGYMTVDRSSKNKGWYWYYQDQAHAWVQIYFPGYGWLDFDTTVGNDAEDSPAPDGTPPDPPQDPSLSLNGIVADVDTLKHLVTVDVTNYIAMNVSHQESFKHIQIMPNNSILLGDSVLKLSQIHIGDTAQALSFDAQIMEGLNAKDEKVLSKLHLPIKIDELHITPKVDPAKKNADTKETHSENHLLVWVILIAFLLFVGIAIYIARFWILFKYNQFRIKQKTAAKEKGAYAFKNVTLLLGRLGLPIATGETVADYASRAQKYLGVEMQQFANVFDTLRFSNQLDSTEMAQNITNAYHNWLENVEAKFGKKKVKKALFIKYHK